jgi:hypothetical protein
MTRTNAFSDLRARPDFDPALLPRCDGGAWPPSDSTDRQQRRVNEFAAVYYAMNRALMCAEAARATGNTLAETAALDEFCAASRARDALEDHYAPEGFLAEPVLENSRYVNLRFTWAGKPRVPCVITHQFEAELTL